ncbi:MAG: protein TolQ [Deltaproteobacteria bacterium]|nr:MAG: protein TolQ [Deltaproteobacteria bacterium]
MELLTQSRGVVLFVLILLIFFSVMCWGIILYKWFVLNQAQNQSLDFLDLFWESKRLDNTYNESELMTRSPVAQVFRAGYIELSKLQRSKGAMDQNMTQQLGGLENIQRAMRRAANTEMSRLESYIPFLATTASAAPFVGLFGTVWGIMKSFISIKESGTAGLNVVAPGIAEALIATAVGLAAAIPAVIAYNFFLAKIRQLDGEVDNFSNDFLNIVKRHFLK